MSWGFFFGGEHSKDYSISGSILGSPYLFRTAIEIGARPNVLFSKRGRFISASLL